MSKRLKKFISNYLITALTLGLVLFVYEQVGSLVAGEYYNLIWWGIVVGTVVILAVIGWRLWVGIENGNLLFDDSND